MNIKQIFTKNWGVKLFITVFVLSLVFIWWLAIYSHGVTPHH